MKLWKDATGSNKSHFEAISIVFAKHKKLLVFFFDQVEPKISSSADVMLYEAGCFSSGEYVLIQVALDIWCGTCHSKISDLIHTLDTDNFNNVLLALSKLRSTQLYFLQDQNDISF